MYTFALKYATSIVIVLVLLVVDKFSAFVIIFFLNFCHYLVHYLDLRRRHFC